MRSFRFNSNRLLDSICVKHLTSYSRDAESRITLAHSVFQRIKTYRFDAVLSVDTLVSFNKYACSGSILTSRAIHNASEKVDCFYRMLQNYHYLS